MKTTGLIGAASKQFGVPFIGALLLTTSPALGQDVPPSIVELSAVIRDFTKDHPDFNVIPADGYAYYHGLVAYDVDEDGNPVYSGGGFKAKSLWKNAAGMPIAPHLFNTCNFLAGTGGGDPGDTGVTSFRVAVDERIRVEKGSVVDSFDSNVGPYGEANSGEAALIMANGNGDRKHYVRVKHKATIMGDVMVHPDDDPAKVVKVSRRGTVTGELGNMDTMVEMPEIEVPVMGDSVGKVRYKRGERTLSEDLHCRKLELKRGAILNIEGDVTILCDEKVKLDDGSEIRLMEDSTLTLYVGEKVDVDDGSMINMNTGNPQLVSIMMLASSGDDDDEDNDDSKISLDDESQVCAWVQGAEAYLKLDDDSEFFGSFLGRRVKVKDGSRLHVDMATASESSGGGVVIYEPEECDLGDVAGSISGSSLGDVDSAASFGEWWRDVLGVNMTTVEPLRLVRNRFGIYFFLADNYRPIDGQLLGNEGDNHNYHFTVELDATFTYDASAAQWIEFRGTDDTYVFINGRLVLDLGGYGFNKLMYMDMDRLGLTDGEPARFQLFHAQRQRGMAIFRMRTNLVLADNSAGSSVNNILED